MQISVENIKCGGCANSIRKALLADARVSAVDIDIDAGLIEIQAPDTLRPELISKLQTLGYPERGSIEGLKALHAKAKSFVSCAVGRMDQNTK
ncbi:heavy-metal-associated domain-containing protein [Thiorhodospira sibirica]|uniref:heavy-metal-associated domain-containing protein n=1 Tax=Thiorhodospira sibirica TaxID=154347 RepID=UPI00022C52C4|nr:heavy-metal-associated domain-containing protein [Thiorhodospira sibirica]